MDLTTLQKAKILCGLISEAEQDDGDWYETLWEGVIGYKPPADQHSADYREWVKNIEEEWDDSSVGENDDETIAHYVKIYT